MTRQTRASAPRGVGRLDDILTELRARGYRMTPQRRAILDAIVRASSHVTAEEILTRIRKRFPDVNISTVYRNLQTLQDLGVVSHAHLGHTAGMFHLTDHGEHQHLVCRRCGGIEDIEAALLEPVRGAVGRARGFDVDLSHFALFGLCRHCRSA